MKKDSRKSYYLDLLAEADPSELKLVDKLIDEVIYYENQMDELKKLPKIRVNPNNPTQQEITKAAKLYKDVANSYMNAIRILLSLLRKVDTSAQDELLKRLSEFE